MTKEQKIIKGIGNLEFEHTFDHDLLKNHAGPDPQADPVKLHRSVTSPRIGKLQRWV